MSLTLSIFYFVGAALALPQKHTERKMGAASGAPTLAIVIRALKSISAIRGKLVFGTWEQIFYGEFDGQRRKRVLIKIIGQ